MVMVIGSLDCIIVALRSDQSTGRIWGEKDKKPIEKSDEFFRQGLQILETLGTKPDLSMGYLFWGESYASQGRKEEALEKLKNGKRDSKKWA